MELQDRLEKAWTDEGRYRKTHRTLSKLAPFIAPADRQLRRSLAGDWPYQRVKARVKALSSE